jgi:hypothetical protein
VATASLVERRGGAWKALSARVSGFTANLCGRTITTAVGACTFLKFTAASSSEVSLGFD